MVLSHVATHPASAGVCVCCLFPLHNGCLNKLGFLLNSYYLCLYSAA